MGGCSSSAFTYKQRFNSVCEQCIKQRKNKSSIKHIETIEREPPFYACANECIEVNYYVCSNNHGFIVIEE